MPSSYFRLASLIVVLAFAAQAASSIDQQMRSAPVRLRPHFEPVADQTSGYRFLSRGNGYELFLADDHAALVLGGNESSPETIRLRWLGGTSTPHPVAEGRLASHSNYFRGSDPAIWRTHVPHYQNIRYRDVWPGIDLVFHGDRKALEYDFVVLPGANPEQIKFVIHGADGLAVGDKGALRLLTARGTMRLDPPVVYQDTAEGRKKIEGRYRFLKDGQLAFAVAEYDGNLPLVIDPVIAFSTYLGGLDSDFGNDIAVDADGYVYVAGFTYEMAHTDNYDIFIVKLTPDGSSLVYSTYIGGEGMEDPPALALDSANNIVIAGSTSSEDFPTTPGVYQPVKPVGESAFVAKLRAADATLLFSTYVGRGEFSDIALDHADNIIAAGQAMSGTFPTTPDAIQQNATSAWDAVVCKLSADGTSLIYSTYLGGSSSERTYAVTVDGNGQAVVVGATSSSDYPTTAGSSQPTDPGDEGSEGFVTKISADGTTIVYSTYLAGGGTAEDVVSDVEVDALGNTYVVGATASASFPTTPGVYRTVRSGAGFNTFISVLGNTGTILYSTYCWQSGMIPTIALDSLNEIHIAGNTLSNRLPENALWLQPLPRWPGNYGFLAKFSPDLATMYYTTPLGGSEDENILDLAIDAVGNLYVTGYTESEDFPTTATAVQPNQTSYRDAFAAKITPSLVPCAYTATADNFDLDWHERTVNVGISASPGCVWRVDGFESWSTPEPMWGIGSGTVTLAIDQNHNTIARSEIVTIGGNEIEVRQTGEPCSYTFVPESRSFGTSGGISTVAVIAPTGCSWTASSTASWITATPETSMSGDGVVQISVPANSGHPRSGSILAADQVLIVNQAGTGTAGTAPAPPTYLFPPDGSGNAPQTPVLSWQAAAGATRYSVYLGIDSIANLKRVSDVLDGTTFVTGKLSAGHQYFWRVVAHNDYGDSAVSSVVWSFIPVSCSAEVTVGQIGFPIGGGSGNVTVTAPGCPWSAYSQDTWVAVTGGATGIGDGTVSFSVQPYEGAAMRTATLSVAGEEVQIGQAGSKSPIITTYAGNGESGCCANGIPATEAPINAVSGLAIDPDGNLYVSDYRYSVVRKVSRITGVITTVVGRDTIVSGVWDDGVPAADARLFLPRDLAFDAEGNLFIADTGKRRIRKVTAATGIITTVAGNGSEGYTGDGGPATAASLDEPRGIVVDRAGNLFFSDTGNHVVRKVEAATGRIFTIAGTGVDGNSGDGGLATAAKLSWPDGLALDAEENLYIVDRSPGRVRKVDTQTGIITTVVGTNYGSSIGDGGPATSARLVGPAGVALDRAGNLFVSEASGSRVRKVDAKTGIISTVAGIGVWDYSGDGGPPNFAALRSPENLAIDDRGVVYVADFNSHVVREIAGVASATSRIGLAADGMWYLDTGDQSWNASGDSAFQYGPLNAGWTSLIGDWDGDGIATPGLYVPSAGIWLLKNSAGPGNADAVFQYGPGGLGWLPVVGDWDGDGIDTPGLYAPDSGFWFLKNSHGPGNADEMFSYGPGGLSWLPLVGDWDGDGVDTPGLYVPDSGSWFLKNSLGPGAADAIFGYGPGGLGWLAFSGDWDGDGTDTIGLYNPNSGYWFLRDQLAGGNADSVFYFRPAGSGAVPIVGTW